MKMDQKPLVALFFTWLHVCKGGAGATIFAGPHGQCMLAIFIDDGKTVSQCIGCKERKSETVEQLKRRMYWKNLRETF